jgi:DNA-directed RNA polymerase subunit RPC12/RpoP
MQRPTYDMADIVRLHLPALKSMQPLTSEQARALAAIGICRTAALGGHSYFCMDCGLVADQSYNSCRNRNCPKCQALAQERWIQARASAILPIPHFHVVFTLPSEFRPLARTHPREIYDALFKCVSAALLEIGWSRLGIRLGLTMVLHTWTRELTFHPHVHVLVSAGGLADGGEFKRAKEKFLLPEQPLSVLFKKKMLNALRRIQKGEVFKMTKGAFGFLLATLANQKWNVYLKKAFHTPALVLAYLGRYTHRVGISNSRLLAVNENEVTFRSKDGRSVTVHPVVFLQRFVQHVLPDGFKKIRHSGLYASPKALAQARANTGPTQAPVCPAPTWQEALRELAGRDVTRCAACGATLFTSLIPADRPIQRRPRSV